MMSTNPPETDKKYDVAISFLIEDISIAQALYDKLSEGFSVFFSPRRQEELAGTNGAESMREPFLTQSRLNVILFKDKWGTTPWTGVESHAIEDSAIKNQFRNVFLLVVQKSTQYPAWLPYSFMRFNLGDYSLEEAIGAIKVRVQEQGGRLAPMTPIKKAEQLKDEALYQADRSRMHWDDGVEKSLDKLEELIREMVRHCDEVNGSGAIKIEYEIHPRLACVLRHDQLGMIVRWNQQHEGSVQKGGLCVEEYNSRLFFNNELGNRVIVRPPNRTKQTLYDTDLSRAREYGWKSKRNPEFIASATLAENLVMHFMDMIAKSRSGRPKNTGY
jgi:hypothetical protein